MKTEAPQLDTLYRIKQDSRNRWSIFYESDRTHRLMKIGTVKRDPGWKVGISYGPVPVTVFSVSYIKPRAARGVLCTLSGVDEGILKLVSDAFKEIRASETVKGRVAVRCDFDRWF